MRAGRDLWAFLETPPDETLSKPVLPGKRFHCIKDIVLHIAIVEDSWLLEDILRDQPVWEVTPDIAGTRAPRHRERLEGRGAFHGRRRPLAGHTARGASHRADRHARAAGGHQAAPHGLDQLPPRTPGDAREREDAVTGLLMVDPQNALFEGIHAKDTTLEAIKNLLERARAANAPVIFVQGIDVGEPGSFGYAIHADLAPLESETVIVKGASHAFHDTALEAALPERSITRIVLCGLKTPGWVTATTCGAIYGGFNVTLAGDAHSTDATDELRADRVVAYTNEFLDGFGLPGYRFRPDHPSVTVVLAGEVEF